MTPVAVPPSLQKKLKTMALVGQPNVGKSVIFNYLTGKYVTVSNFPGTTVDLSRGHGIFNKAEWEVYDTPGVFSLQARTDDERVTRDLIFETKPDVIIQIADAKNLGKGLHLTLELAEFNIPMILALNMADEALDRGVAIDTKRLSHLLGIPVVQTVAITGEGVAELKALVEKAAVPHARPRYDVRVQEALRQIESVFLTHQTAERALSVALFSKDQSAWKHAIRITQPDSLGKLETIIRDVTKVFVRPTEALLFEAKQHVTQEIMGEVYAIQKINTKSWLSKLGNWVMRPFPGYIVALLCMYLLYEFVGVFGAGFLVNFLEKTVFGEYLNPFFTHVIDAAIPWKIVQDAFVGPYGILTMALTYALALILPIVTTFFFFFGFMEDSGYLPRLAVMMDRFFRLMGLNGRAILPMILGLGCDTMATVTTRIMDTEKEKIILSILLTLSVPCSAQLGAILGMAGGLSIKVLIVWLVVTCGTMMLVGWGASKVLPGARSPFLVELPPLRIPKMINIAKKIKARLKWYLSEVIPLFMVATFALFLLDKLKLLQVIENIFEPVVVSFLGLPAKASEAFLIGFFRRDYGAAGFFNMAQNHLLNPRQVAVSMVVITLFMPCVAHLLITIKERGLKVTAGIVAFVLSFSLGIGGLVNLILERTSFL